MFYHQLLDKMPKGIQGMINLNSNINVAKLMKLEYTFQKQSYVVLVNKSDHLLRPESTSLFLKKL